MEYVTLAAGGSFQENFSVGPLAAMYRRLRALLRAGVRDGVFRRLDPADFYRVIYSSLLMRLVFPDESLLLRQPTRAQVRKVQGWLWNLARRYCQPP
jgi:hypothetical protein